MNSIDKEFSSNEYLGVNKVKKNDHITTLKSKNYEAKNNKSKCESLNNEKDVGKFQDVKSSLNKIKEKFNLNKKFSNLVKIDGELNNTEILSENSNMQSTYAKYDANLENSLHNNENLNLNNTNSSELKDEKKTTMQPEKINENKSLLVGFNSFLQNVKFLKFFKNKNSKIAILVVILSIVLIMFLNLSTTTSTDNAKVNTQNFNSLDYVSSSNYVKNLENKLIEVLSKIKGAGNVSVMITLESGPELKIANSVDERTNTSTSTSTTTTSVTVVENPIIITQNGQSSPLVLMEIMPVIKGVIVVAQGANNTKVKLELLQAVQALLDVSGGNIQIYAGI